jgi:hypothetical protein
MAGVSYGNERPLGSGPLVAASRVWRRILGFAHQAPPDSTAEIGIDQAGADVPRISGMTA